MTERKPLNVTREQAAESLGCSLRYFDETIRPQLRVVYMGRKVMIPLVELERWNERTATKLTA